MSKAQEVLIILVFFSHLLDGQVIQFTDVTQVSGIGLPGILTESCAWGDYDNDGDQDLYLTNNGKNILFRNNGTDLFSDVTDQAGVGDELFGVGTAFADLDNDGDLDLYVVNFDSGSDVLYRNNGPDSNSNYTYSDISFEAGTTIERSSRGMAFIDFNRDGLLDIYINAIGADILYQNKGNLIFEDVASELGINNSLGQGVGVVATDINNDGWIDLYTGNRSNDLSNLYINQGGISFIDLADSLGIQYAGLGMGVASFDYDNDLDMDLYWTTWPGVNSPLVRNRFYKNQLSETGGLLPFEEIGELTRTQDSLGWGVSINTADINNDGYEDFFVTNGANDNSGPSVLFLNQAGQSFRNRTDVIGGGVFDGRGVSFADYDNDGDMDMVVTTDSDNGDVTRLYRNDTNNNSNSITFQLVGLQSNRSAIGARVEVTTADRTTVKEVSGGAGRGSFNSIPLEFGLDTLQVVDKVSIRWPSGISSTHGPYGTGIHEIIEPQCELAFRILNNIPITTDTYKSGGDIISSGSIITASNVTFIIEGDAYLNPQFNVSQNSSLKIQQESCTNP